MARTSLSPMASKEKTEFGGTWMGYTSLLVFDQPAHGRAQLPW